MNIDQNMQRRIWDTEMEILDVIDKVCRENGLKYSLAYGSMLGAVRHGGFIPWDDDMDIWMLRDDYDKFIEIWERNPINGYFLLRQETSPEYPQNFTKIRKCNTAFVSEGEEIANYHHGIFVDIFPLDAICNNVFGAKLQRFSALAYMLYCRGYASTRDGKMMYWASKICLEFVPKGIRKSLKKFFKSQMQKYNCSDYGAKRLACCVTAGASKRYFLKEWVCKVKDVSFENRKYMCFATTDKILEVEYKNYMQLPPEEQRVWKHTPVIIDFKKEYWPNQK